MKRLNKIYPNMWVTLRIFATILLTVATAERMAPMALMKTNAPDGTQISK